MLEIVDILEKLKQLDEPTYEKIARGVPLQPCGQYMVFDRGEVRACQYHEAYMPFGDLLPEVAEAWLQFCIQRAVAAKNWWLKLSTYTALPSAKIQKPDDPAWKEYHGFGESLAVAILAAYIACLESQP
ncbi:MAG: hypothetical protein WC455_24465 [Dehalococcoidia bacterium]|jgi:hypothetical protein